MEALLEAVQNFGQDGCSSSLTTCEAELQELMKQIDIMVAQKKSEWEAQFQSVETRLKVREQELSAFRLLLDQKHTEVGLLRQQLQDNEKVQRDMVVQYETQLNIFREEIGKLKKSYEKLQRRQLKDRREHVKERSEKEGISELNRLSKKVEEFREKSLEWEKQRLCYQQQVASLDTERKLLAEQCKTIQQQTVKYQTQLSGQKQLIEQTELTSQSEMQHLRSQLERANDTICANDMTMERLNMTVDELEAANQQFKSGQQLLQEELQHLQQLIQKSVEENEELKSKLEAQENIIQSKDLQQKQLYEELVRCNELLQAKEKTASRSLEDSLLEQPCSDISHRQPELQQAAVQFQENLQGDMDLKEEFLLLQHSLDSSNDRCTFLSGEICKKGEDLKQMEEEHSKCKMDIKKLRDQLSSLEQQRHSELKGMKLEIAQLTTELHQRDLTIATMSAATSNMERQLRIELDKTDKKVQEVKITQIQLETMKSENEYLAAMLKVNGNCSITDLRDGYFSSLRQLDQENQQLQKELADVRSKLETSTKVSQDRYEMLLLQIQNKLTDIRETEDRRVEELQLEHKKEIEELQNKLREMVAQSEESKHASQSQHQCSESDFHNLTEGRITERTFSNTVQSDSSNASVSESSHGVTSCVTLSADENEAYFSDNSSAHSAHSLPSEQFLSLSPTIASTKTSIAVRYLEEEDRRSQQLLQRLDMHIEELKAESERTVDKYV
ncbi:centrosomal protein of 63 kDa isoform X3 [Rhincodon typus]|uniref:centrosomal protein of 63 kDa isoform X3 n=1 Tax=Rhincodon typus TaxID=259920 RepID=UPI002030C879|nr:centrosomal protein of 63 kDa isoform X3 [Rhincodon typus]